MVGDRTLEGLGHALFALGLRLEAISENLANVNTPGYRRKDVFFRQELGRFFREGGSFRPRISYPGPGITRLDRSEVELDREMVALAETALLYEALVQEAVFKLRSLRTAITEGRK